MYYESMFELLRIPGRSAWLDDVGFRGNLVRRAGDTLVHVGGHAPGTPIRAALREEAYGSANWVVRIPSSSGPRDFTDSELTIPWAQATGTWVAEAPAVVSVSAMGYPTFGDVPLPEETGTEATHPINVPSAGIVVPDYFALYADQGEEVLRLSGDGQLFWRGRLIETDWELVAGLRDLLGGLRTGRIEPPSEIPRLTEWERLRDGADD